MSLFKRNKETLAPVAYAENFRGGAKA